MKFDRFSDCKCQQHWHRQHRHSDPIDKQVAMRHLCQPKYLHSPTSSIYIAVGRGPLGFLWTNMLLNFQYKAITWEFATSSWYRHFARESYDPRAPDSSAAVVINIRNRKGKERDERSTSALLCLRLPMSVNEVTYQGRYAVNVGPVQPCTPSTHTQTVT